MNLVTILFIAFGLSMDAFAVSVANGANTKFNRILFSSAVFGLFQGVQPVLGWAAGTSIRSLITDSDHWIAFFLLAFIGCKMIYESFTKGRNKKDACYYNSNYCILMLGVATSIDALVVGLSFSFLQVSIIFPSIIIGIITFLMSLTGCGLGRKFGTLIGSKFELAGGFILLFIGVKILVEHLS